MELKIERRMGRVAISPGCVEFLGAISRLESFLTQMKVEETGEGSVSERVRLPVLGWAEQDGWQTNRPVIPNLPTSIPSAIYKVNAVKDFPEVSCGHRHRVFFQCCFDNRQALGTNLLRMNLAISAFERGEGYIGRAIMLTVDSNAKKFYGWDSSVGTSEEYEFAAMGPYESRLSQEIDVWKIRKP